jgi:hypothetical protein
MSWRGIANLDAKIFAVPLEGTTSKMGPIVGDDLVWDPESTYDGLDELHCWLLVDFDHRGCFWSLGKLVDGNIEESKPSGGAGERPHDVQPLDSEGPWG